MRGRDDRSGGLFSYVRLEERVPADHPLRPIRALADEALAALNGRFEGLYSSMGRPSIPPEMLLRATLLQAFFSVLSERLLMEQINYNLLFRWFVGLVPFGAVVAAAGQDAALGRALLGRRDADRRLGLDEELPAEGRLGLAARAGAQRRARLPQGEALEREPRLDHRSRRAALPQGQRPREPAVLHGARPDGEPQRPCGRCRAYARHRDG